ncbi:hypothetical protein B0T16DRAFT_492405 [Cercophora newfieldiana]|uniref:F-box domain-containing protein n=1 Tax=Cercophora newfieldiana TaxID=92897 RepID=A0AA39YC84_9PEZI|nr:hypothetical protein B0T16DRAFT_492405 [Cercophora newfieldiana]
MAETRHSHLLALPEEILVMIVREFVEVSRHKISEMVEPSFLQLRCVNKRFHWLTLPSVAKEFFEHRDIMFAGSSAENFFVDICCHPVFRPAIKSFAIAPLHLRDPATVRRGTLPESYWNWPEWPTYVPTKKQAIAFLSQLTPKQRKAYDAQLAYQEHLQNVAPLLIASTISQLPNLQSIGITDSRNATGAKALRVLSFAQMELPDGGPEPKSDLAFFWPSDDSDRHLGLFWLGSVQTEMFPTIASLTNKGLSAIRKSIWEFHLGERTLQSTRDTVSSIITATLMGIARSGVRLPMFHVGSRCMHPNPITACMLAPSRAAVKYFQRYPLRVKSVQLILETLGFWADPDMWSSDLVGFLNLFSGLESLDLHFEMDDRDRYLTEIAQQLRLPDLRHFGSRTLWSMKTPSSNSCTNIVTLCIVSNLTTVVLI